MVKLVTRRGLNHLLGKGNRSEGKNFFKIAVEAFKIYFQSRCGMITAGMGPDYNILEA